MLLELTQMPPKIRVLRSQDMDFPSPHLPYNITHFPDRTTQLRGGGWKPFDSKKGYRFGHHGYINWRMWDPSERYVGRCRFIQCTSNLEGKL